MGAAGGDIDGDGWPDVFVANDAEPNVLFRNRGNGTFEEVADGWGVAVNQFGSPVSAMGADLRDVDNDGRLDLFVTDLSNEGFLLFRNAGAHFDDASDSGRITMPTLPYSGWSNPVDDFDNDGRMDLVVTALGDRPKLLRNVTEPQARWITLRLVGRTSNRDGLGASVRLTLDDGSVLVNHATTSVGFASSADPRVHFGLGRDGQIKRIELVWPSGIRQIIERPTINAVLTIEEH